MSSQEYEEDNEKEFNDSTGKFKKPSNNSFLNRLYTKYFNNSFSLPFILALILLVLSLDSFSFDNDDSILSKIFWNSNSIDPLTYDFFAQTNKNLKLYEKINNYISPNHEPIGFDNENFKRFRTEPGSPPFISNPGIYPSNNLNRKNNDDLINLSNNSNQFKGFKGFLYYLLTFGGNLIPNSLPKRQIYIILGSSPNIGIEKELSRGDWLTEKISIINKKAYAKRHNYKLVFQNSFNDPNDIIRANSLDSLSAHQKRYQHENREGWERFDAIRQIMRTHTFNNPKVEEWYWYLDLHTLIMQPERSIEEVVFSIIEKASRTGAFLYNSDNLDDVKDKDLTWSNLAYKREFSRFDVDPETSKLTHKDIDLILTEDCYGINLSSFLIRRSKWSELLLDMLWEPVMYRQMHLNWNKLERKDLPHNYGFSLNEGEEKKENFNGSPAEIEERNCLEYFLSTQAWLRTRTAVLPTRVFNSISNDSCVIDPEKTLDLIDMEMDDDLIDALLGSDDLDLLVIKEKLSANVMNNKFKVLDLHYEPSDFLYSFAACRWGCENRVKDAMVWYKDIHKKQIFDDLI